MKFVPIDVKNPKTRKRYHYEVLRMLEEFIDSEENTIEVIFKEGEYKDEYSCANVIRKNIEREDLPIEVHVLNRRIYVFRKS